MTPTETKLRRARNNLETSIGFADEAELDVMRAEVSRLEAEVARNAKRNRYSRARREALAFYGIVAGRKE